jgi:hypothetical protein
MGLLSWLAAKVDPTRSPEEPGWLRRWVIPGPGKDDPRVDRIQQAAAEDVAEMEAEDREYFRQDGPGYREGDQ